MHNLIPYLIKLSISLSLVYLFYQLALRRLTFYNWNRWYLLGYSLLCFVIPVINVFSIVPEQSAIVQYIPVVDQFDASQQVNEPAGVDWKWLCMLVMATGMVLMIVRLLIQYYSLFRMRSKAVLLYSDRVKLYHIDQPVIPFSFGNSIFVNQHRHSEEELKDIIRHEFIHVKQRHSVDMMVSEWLCIVNWYNPFAWLLRKAMRQNLEFIADHQVLQTGLDRKQYQYLLLKVMGHSSFSIASKFNFSNLKKRIAMMNKTQSAKVHLIRFLFMLPLLAVILLAFRNTRQQLQQPAAAVVADTTAPVSSKNIHEIVSTEVQTKTNANVKCVTVTELHRVVNDQVQANVKNEVNDIVAYTLRTQKGNPVRRDTAPEPPAAPASPNVKMPEDVQSISVMSVDKASKTVTLTLKNGQVEKYNLNVPAEKEAFEKKYGSLPEPPKPPVAPAPAVGGRPNIKMSDQIKSMSVIKNGKGGHSFISIILKNGEVEKYDLNVPAEKEAFEKKYGSLPETPKPPVAPTPAAAPEATPAPPTPPTPPTPPVVKDGAITIVADTIHIFDSNARKIRIVSKRISEVNEKEKEKPSAEVLRANMVPAKHFKPKEGNMYPENILLNLKLGEVVAVGHLQTQLNEIVVVGRPARVTVN